MKSEINKTILQTLSSNISYRNRKAVECVISDKNTSTGL